MKLLLYFLPILIIMFSCSNSTRHENNDSLCILNDTIIERHKHVTQGENDYEFSKYDINMSYYKSTPKSLDVLPTTYHRYITNDSTIEYVRSYINSNIREKYLVIRTCNTADVSILKLKPESDDELSFYELKQIINQIPMSFTLTTQEFREFNNKTGWVKLIEHRQQDKIIYLNKTNEKDTFYVRKADSLYNTGKKIGVIMNPYNKDKIIPPLFIGGETALQENINKQLNHNLLNGKNIISPRVILELVISQNGDISDIKILRSIDSELDAEAIRVCHKLPKFIPGTKNGVPTELPYITAVTFINE